eukprot:300868-Lingulodinium_polyedra.AAC.1
MRRPTTSRAHTRASTRPASARPRLRLALLPRFSVGARVAPRSSTPRRRCSRPATASSPHGASGTRRSAAVTTAGPRTR